MTYSEKLRDPRWQRCRLGVFDRAFWRCEECQASTETLTIHHVVYIKGRDPWEYPASLLQCLCEPCHKHREEIFRKITDASKIALKNFLTIRLVQCHKKLMAVALEELE
jgi:5-methylcytosine-specific restriction endonuclease McrA